MAFMTAIIVLFATARGEMVWWLAATAAVSVQLAIWAEGSCGSLIMQSVCARAKQCEAGSLDLPANEGSPLLMSSSFARRNVDRRA
jgi:hypothetical protein